MIMNKSFSRFLCILFSIIVLTGCGTKEEPVTPPEPEKETTSENEDESLTGLHHVEIEIKEYGTISLELDADTAPISVTTHHNIIQADVQGF